MTRRCLDCGVHIQHRQGARCAACAAAKRPAGQWHVLRRQCLTRDKQTCQGCGSRSDLEAHHRVPLARGGLNVLANLITLCDACHRRWHAFMNQPTST